MEKPSIARGAKWEHAHSYSACLLRLDFLHRPRCAGFHQLHKKEFTLQVIRLKSNGTWCPGGTSLQVLHKVQELMSRTGRAPESLPDRIIFGSTCTNITDCTRKKVQVKFLESAREWHLTQQDSDLVTGVPRTEQTWKYNATRPAIHCANGGVGQTRFCDDKRICHQ